jgi:hypothetical protein
VEQLDARLSEYNEVLYEWNDRLNSNLALLRSHFGPAAREYLYLLYEDFARVGAQLETAARQARHGKNVAQELDGIDLEFAAGPETLSSRVYRLGLAMMAQLREGVVGRRAPDKLPIPSLGSDSQRSATARRAARRS